MGISPTLPRPNPLSQEANLPSSSHQVSFTAGIMKVGL